MLISFQNPRFTDYLQKQIRIYCNLFLIEDFWEHVSIVFTKAYYYTPKTDFDSIKQDLESDNGLINLIMDYIKEETEKINESKKNDTDFKKIKAPCKLPVFFIDSTLEIEEKKNIRTKEEVNKLIEWARIKEYLDLQNINKNKIDVNYLSTERIEDIIPEEEEKFLEGSSNKLKIYSKKVFAQYKKITFHNEIVFIKDPEPYKIEEIKEEEILSPKKCISSQENKNGKIDIYEIEHLAIKSKKRVIENGHNKEWEDNTNQSDLESSRIISKDKIEENYKYELIEENSDSDKTIEKYNYVKNSTINRHHGPRRLLPGGVPLGKRLRGARHHPPLVVVQHWPHRTPLPRRMGARHEKQTPAHPALWRHDRLVVTRAYHPESAAR
jgi:hypothetical protein